MQKYNPTPNNNGSPFLPEPKSVKTCLQRVFLPRQISGRPYGSHLSNLPIAVCGEGVPLSNITARPHGSYLSNLPIAVCGEGVLLSNITARPHGSHLSNSPRPVYRECFYGEPFLGEWEGIPLKFTNSCVRRGRPLVQYYCP